MKYLVDSNLLSELTKPSPHPRVLDWLRTHERNIVVDPIILGELRFGILLLPKGRKRATLERWFDAGVHRIHCLPWDADTGLQWAALLAKLRATALTHEPATGVSKVDSTPSVFLKIEIMALIF